MTYHEKYDIYPDTTTINLLNTDTLLIDFQISSKVLSELTCISKDEIRYYNPAFKDDIFPINSIISLPKNSIDDFFYNYQSYKEFTEKVHKKEILIDETRIVYSVVSGDYLGKIAKNHNIKIHQIQKWNGLKTTKLNIGDQLVLYVADDVLNDINNVEPSKILHIVQKGDTLWDIAKMYSGVSIEKIKKLNKLDNNNLKPGSRLLIPKV